MNKAHIIVIVGSLAAALLPVAGNATSGPDLKDPKLIDAGRHQFAQTCVYCHGNEGTGGKAGPLKGRTDLTPDYLFNTISNGRRTGARVMPPWKDTLDQDTIWSLAAYILSLGGTSQAASQ